MQLRRHQRTALAALDAGWRTGRTRAWVVLPPGAGKTLVGLETMRRRVAAGAVRQAVVLGPNTAIQAQWQSQAAALGLEVSGDRALTSMVTTLTYQSVAVFDADAEVTDDAVEAPLLSRLHDNGRALVAAMRAAGPILLVLDECHHLLDVWGRLLGELLDQLPEAQVLGLTATPPDALTVDQAELVDALFGRIAFEVSIPAVVREGDLAPFAELAWLTTPNPAEAEWLAAQALRFAELVYQLTDPAFGSIGFLPWLDRRFVTPVGTKVTWAALTKQEPVLCAAALRMHHAGLLALPEGARLTEEHRHDPTADDWVGLESDTEVVQAVRRALPAVGYQLTRRGIRRGRSPVDRVLARSESKMTAAVEIVGHEHLALGDRLRMLVLCDHERAAATLPVALEGVLDVQAGAALAMLRLLVADPTCSRLSPLLVTGRTVAGAPETVAALHELVAGSEPGLAAGLHVVPLADGLASLEGSWSSRTWVGWVTRFFQEGRSQVLVGTRGLLGEGWDARRITGLVDLTAATTTTAVVQTRGRALRTDPDWPEKVAVNWSVACVSEAHPKGDNDWQRLVRKHAGFYGVDDDGEVVDGVAHLDPLFSPYAPPPVGEFDAINARMVERSQKRELVRDRWRVGEPYDDTVARTVRIEPRAPGRLGTSTEPAAVAVRERGLDVRGDRPRMLAPGAVALAVVGVVLGVSVLLGAAPVILLIALAALGAGSAWQVRRAVAEGRRRLQVAAEPP